MNFILPQAILISFGIPILIMGIACFIYIVSGTDARDTKEQNEQRLKLMEETENKFKT